MNLAVGVASFGGGLWLLVESAEGLVKTLRAWAVGAGVSGIVLGAVVLGFDLESTATGVAASLDDLPGTAIGSSIGAAIFLVTVGLGLAGLIAPFAVPPPLPLLGVGAVAAVLPAGLAADGELSRADGAVLLIAFVILLAVVLRSRRGKAMPATDEPVPSRVRLRVAGGLIGLIAGAELLVFGTARVVGALGVSETVFGLLVVAAAVSFEEIVLETLPAYRGVPELSVGNALGTLLFLLTGSLGTIVLVKPLELPATVVSYHLPALLLTVGLALAVLLRGRLGRPEGAVLLLGYGVYVAGALGAGT